MCTCKEVLLAAKFYSLIASAESFSNLNHLRHKQRCNANHKKSSTASTKWYEVLMVRCGFFKP